MKIKSGRILNSSSGNTLCGVTQRISSRVNFQQQQQQNKTKQYKTKQQEQEQEQHYIHTDSKRYLAHSTAKGIKMLERCAT